MGGEKIGDAVKTYIRSQFMDTPTERPRAASCDSMASFLGFLLHTEGAYDVPTPCEDGDECSVCALFEGCDECEDCGTDACEEDEPFVDVYVTPSMSRYIMGDSVSASYASASIPPLTAYRVPSRLIATPSCSEPCSVCYVDILADRPRVCMGSRSAHMDCWAVERMSRF